MRAVILAGGLGTRVRPYTFTVPKPLLPLGDRALLDHLIEHLAKNDIADITISLGYQAQLVRAYFGDGSRHGVRIDYVEEPRPLGTAGCLSLIREQLVREGRPFFLMNGDLVTRLDFRALAAFHAERRAALTVGFVNHVYKSPFGVLKFDGDDIVDVVEKPSYEQAVSAGIYCISPSALTAVPDDAFFTMPDLAVALRKSGERVVGYQIREFWRALETRDQFDELLREAEADATIHDLVAAHPPAGGAAESTRPR
jgi:NDP-sugar pyrophosphorylase family protein